MNQAVERYSRDRINFNHARLSGAQAEFIGIFLRFEFALKECGYARKTDGDAVVDWGRFAKEQLGPDFYEKVRASSEADTMMKRPPLKQVVRDGKLHFDPSRAPAKNVDELLTHVRTVRNNLLHGGKSGDPDGRRNGKLIAGAKWVVEEVLRRVEKVRNAFEGNY